MMFVDGMGWLSLAPRDLKNDIERRCDLITAREARELYGAGDPAGSIFGILSGRVDMHLPLWGEQGSLAHVSGPGWWIGDMAAVTGQPRRFEITVQRDTQLLRLSRAEISRICDRHPMMFRHLLLMSAANQGLAIDAAEALGLADPMQRITACLLRIDKGGPGWKGRLMLTQGELASIAKLSRRRTNAALQDLAAAGLLRPGYGQIELLDREALKNFMEGATQKLRNGDLVGKAPLTQADGRSAQVAGISPPPSTE
jgi:CRP/FNR family cyclic AMP-dependent transcriptional regulator